MTELAAESAPAIVLQLVVLMIFQAATGNVLQVSGKFVPTILAFLKPYLQDEDFIALQSYQGKSKFLWCFFFLFGYSLTIFL